MSGEPQELTPEQAMEALRRATAGFAEAMSWAKATFAEGNSFQHHRQGREKEAAVLLDALPEQQRHALVKWAFWVTDVLDDCHP